MERFVPTGVTGRAFSSPSEERISWDGLRVPLAFCAGGRGLVTSPERRNRACRDTSSRWRSFWPSWGSTGSRPAALRRVARAADILGDEDPGRFCGAGVSLAEPLRSEEAATTAVKTRRASTSGLRMVAIELHRGGREARP